MKYLVIYAHPPVRCFNEKVVAEIVKTVESKGDEVIVRDLYKMKFDPVLSVEDLTGFRRLEIPKAIQKEQQYICNADIIIFVYPIWWGDMPAIMKGYIDRVFSYGFAYKYKKECGVTGLLCDKKAIIFSSAGDSEEDFVEKFGMVEAMEKTIDRNKFGFCGIEVLEHKYFYGNPMTTPKKLPGYMEDIAEIIRKY